MSNLLTSYSVLLDASNGSDRDAIYGLASSRRLSRLIRVVDSCLHDRRPLGLWCAVRRTGIVGAKRQGEPWRTTKPDPIAQRPRDLGYRTLRLHTTITQIPVQRLFLNSGYEELGRTQLGGQHFIFFERELE